MGFFKPGFKVPRPSCGMDLSSGRIATKEKEFMLLLNVIDFLSLYLSWNIR